MNPDVVRLATEVTKYNTFCKHDTKPIYSFHVYFPNETICISELCLNIVELSLLLPQRHYILRWDGQVHSVTFKSYNLWLNLLNRNQFIFHVSQSVSLWYSSSVNVCLTESDTLLLLSISYILFIPPLPHSYSHARHGTQGLPPAKSILWVGYIPSPFSAPYEGKAKYFDNIWPFCQGYTFFFHFYLSHFSFILRTNQFSLSPLLPYPPHSHLSQCPMIES